MSSVYVVIGGSGEYDDYREYIVKAFYDETKAGEYVTLCQTEANELKKQYDTSYYNNPYLSDEEWEQAHKAHVAFIETFRGKATYDTKLDLYDLTVYRYEVVEIE